jgi:hypothetical protein
MSTMRMKCANCGSHEINEDCHNRVIGRHSNLCDVCYWKFEYYEVLNQYNKMLAKGLKKPKCSTCSYWDPLVKNTDHLGFCKRKEVFELKTSVNLCKHHKLYTEDA